MAITEQDQRAIDEAVEKLYYVSTDAQGNKSIEPFYPDYRDTNEFLLQQAYDDRKTAFEQNQHGEPEDTLLLDMEDKISEMYMEELWEVEDNIMSEAGFDSGRDEEQLEYLRDTYAIILPFDHYLDQQVKVNIMLDAKDEGNRDFVSIAEQNEALCGMLSPEDAKKTLAEETGLTFLVQQQGHTMEELQQTMSAYQEFFYGENADHSASYERRYADFEKGRNPFLVSVCLELDNMTNYMNTVTILASVSLKEFAEMMKPGKQITFPKDAMVGIYSPWNGGGSVLDVALEKELSIPSDKIWDVQIEGAKLDFQYSVDATYGLIGSAWKEVKEITDAAPEKKPSLDNVIQAAQFKSQSGADRNGISQEPQR